MRLLTRPDFDGLVCAALLKKLDIADELKFVHPQDVRDGLVSVTERDILANLPYVQGAGLWFAHLSSEEESADAAVEVEGECRAAPSTARIIFEYYGGRGTFGPDAEEMVAAADRASAAHWTVDEILNPSGWGLLAFLTDERTGLEQFGNFRCGREQLLKELSEMLAAMSVGEILHHPDVKERAKCYFGTNDPFRSMIRSHTRIDGNLIITDLRGAEIVYPGNRFLVYALYPEQNVSIWIADEPGRQICKIACGRSIVNRTAKTDIGAILSKYGGSGHRASGSCRVSAAKADEVLNALTAALKEE